MLPAEGPGDREHPVGFAVGLGAGGLAVIAGSQGRLGVAAESLHEVAHGARVQVQVLGDLGGGLTQSGPPPDHRSDRVRDGAWHGADSGSIEVRASP
jgi:hypothetical protein